jgi:hypothetical protein
MRCSPKVAEVLPILYLRGLSTGDFREGLAALLGEHAAGLSASGATLLVCCERDCLHGRRLAACELVGWPCELARPSNSRETTPIEGRRAQQGAAADVAQRIPAEGW